jgi:hypothetical protein
VPGGDRQVERVGVGRRVEAFGEAAQEGGGSFHRHSPAWIMWQDGHGTRGLRGGGDAAQSASNRSPSSYMTSSPGRIEPSHPQAQIPV